ncbi:MAG: aspartate aminotransferase family protein [Candidatus Tumulicola sp.]
MSEDDPLERLSGAVPGPRTAEHIPALRAYESQNVTHLADDFPVFWESARGATVVDVDGNRYLDLTAAFGVANVGHANPRVTAAVADQAERLMHGMGDVHPTAVRARLLERLAQILPPGLKKTFLATTGSEAVEAALKTATLATGRSRFASYRGAYHGLSLGALTVCGIDKFREPFAPALGQRALLLDYPGSDETADGAIARTRAELTGHTDVAALLIEPIQGRAGCIVPPPGYLSAVRALCDDLGILMIVDEIYTGFGRTGTWFAVDREGVLPDIICIGKAMGSGFPISAAVGRAEVMDAWPLSNGEALHTSTYLGNPMGCAAALATIGELARRHLPARAAALEPFLRSRLNALTSRRVVVGVRGRGLLWGVQLANPGVAAATVKRALRAGLILLQSGAAGDVIAITPPLVITERQLARAVEILEAAIDAIE